MIGTRAYVAAALLAAPLSVLLGIGSAAPAAAAPGGFHAITPQRAVDTRNTVALQAGDTRSVHIAGVGGVPAAAVAVALNVTVVEPNTNGFLTVYPEGQTPPNTSNLNFAISQTVANMVTTAMGTNGNIEVVNSSGDEANIIVDVAGWYDSGFHPTTPTRLMDTRNGQGGVTIGAGQTRTLAIAGSAGVPSSASAVAINVTAVVPTSAGFLTVWPNGAPRPEASNLNFGAGQIVPNMVTTGLGGGAISIYNASGDTDVLVDLAGWYDGALHPLQPTRIMDTRSSQCLVRMGPGEVRLVAVAGQAGVPANAGAVSMNVTAINPTAPTFLTLWPSGNKQPEASNLNTGGGAVPNLVNVGLGADGRVAIANAAGVVDVLIDVNGWFDGTGSVTPNGTCETVGTKPSLATNGAEVAPANGYIFGPAKYGQSGDNVSALQHRLYDLGFWVADFDGYYGQVTGQAVLAFQKYMGLQRTGNLDARGAYLLSIMSYKPIATSKTGDLAEVDKHKQLLFFIRGGKTIWTLNTSTGSDIPYTETNQRDGGTINGDAHTPEGRFQIYNAFSDGWENGQLGQLYRPRYFSGGAAIHGAPNIPGYPASHGCVRVSTTFMDWVWETNLLPMGGSVWVHN